VSFIALLRMILLVYLSLFSSASHVKHCLPWSLNMVSFESMLVRALNELYSKEKIAAMAYKLPMVRYQKQGFDVYSDSRHYEWYCAFECKSLDASEEHALYFSQYFHHVKGIHQLEYENEISLKTGRNTFLAVELRRRRGVRKSAYLVPWRTVIVAYNAGYVGLEQEQILECVELEYGGGAYHITPEVKEQYISQCCGKPKSEKVQTSAVRDWIKSRSTRRRKSEHDELN
jgi:hypothetical protein